MDRDDKLKYLQDSGNLDFREYPFCNMSQVASSNDLSNFSTQEVSTLPPYVSDQPADISLFPLVQGKAYFDYLNATLG